MVLPNILDAEDLLGSVQTSSPSHCDTHGPSHIDCVSAFEQRSWPLDNGFCFSLQES